MKKLAIILSLLFGISSFGIGQTSVRSKAERMFSKREKEIKPRKQMSHFSKAPKDYKMQYNGTKNRKKQVAESKYNVAGNGRFNSTKKFDNTASNKLKKVRNRSTGTYTMK